MQAQPADSQPEDAISQNTTQNESNLQSQNAFNEQQQQHQQLDQGYGSSQQDNNEGRSGISSLSKSESANIDERQVIFGNIAYRKFEHSKDDNLKFTLDF